MFYKNNYRPAFAVAGATSSASNRTPSNGVMFNSADNETEDFNSFSSSQKRTESTKKAPKPRRNNTFEINRKALLVGAAVVLAFLLIVIGLVSVANNSGSDLKAKNNTFASYELDGKFYVAMKGEIVGAGFENEIELTPATDNSFAYVVEDTADGYNIYILERIRSG